MGKSQHIAQQVDVIPSAPSQSPNIEQGYIPPPPPPPPFSTLHHGVQYQPAFINPSFVPDVKPQPNFVQNQHEPISTHPIVSKRENNETYCQRLHTNRRQTTSISGGNLLLLKCCAIVYEFFL